jgi:hypothetical protein
VGVVRWSLLDGAVCCFEPFLKFEFLCSDTCEHCACYALMRC